MLSLESLVKKEHLVLSAESLTDRGQRGSAGAVTLSPET